jgi:hypothetical protein
VLKGRENSRSLKRADETLQALQAQGAAVRDDMADLMLARIVVKLDRAAEA